MEYYCNIHDKKYKSYKSLWKHNYVYHKVDVVSNITTSPSTVVENVVNNVVEETKEDNKICKNCKKVFCDRVYRWRHEKKCIKIIFENEKNEIEIMKKQIEENKKASEKEIAEYKKEMEKLKDIIQKSLKIHPQTLNKINNQLNNNGTINNITMVQLGHENLSEVLSTKEKRFILDRQAMSLNHLVDLIHTSDKYKKFHNVYITNLQSTFAYKFDEKKNKFIAVNKNELIDDIVDSRMYDIEKFYEEIYPKLEQEKARQIKRFIDRMGNEKDGLKGIKKEEIKLIIYNNKEKILLDSHPIIIDKDLEL
jgi:hypothetical protein